MSVLPLGMIWYVALVLLVILAWAAIVAYRPAEDRTGVRFRIMAAMCAILAVALSILGYIHGDTILESMVLIGAGMFLAFLAIKNQRKPDSN